MDLFVSFLTGLDRVKNVHLHSGLGPIGIATAQEVDDFPVVGDGVSGQICSLFVIFDFQINRLINDRISCMANWLWVAAARAL